METNQLIKELQKGILYWYPFQENVNILFVEQEQTPLRELFCKADVCSVTDIEKDAFLQKRYDYIIAVHVIEHLRAPQVFFERCRKLLNQTGKLLFTMDNRMGLRYFCGDRDPFTNRNFDSIENYRRISAVDLEKQEGRLWDKVTIENDLKKAGFSIWQSFSVLPNVDTPQLLYAQDYMPEEDLSMRYFPMYSYPDSVFLEEAYLYDALVKNQMFHQMANGYLFECALDDNLTNVKHVTLSLDRGEASAMATMIHGNQMVQKKALYEEGKQRLKQLQENHADLQNHGISVVEGVLKEDVFEMPYIKADVAMIYLQNLLKNDIDAFIKEIDRLRSMILQSSEHVEPVLTEYEQREIIADAPIHQGVWLKKAYFDLVPLNAFYRNGEYLFFDQEFYIENFPANAILVRTIDIIYGGHTELEAILPRTFFWQRYDMEAQVPYLRRKAAEFLQELRHQKELRVYNERHQANLGVVHSNRQKMNFSADEYRKLFLNIFEGLEKFELYVFGSGNFAKKFLDLYGKKYQVKAILDNNADKWGSEMSGIPICSPEVLRDMDLQECKVMICIKNYLGVMQQLKEMGVKHFGIYDVNVIYPSVHTVQEVRTDMKSDAFVPKKKYHTGYIAGVFDLYHIGHLNMFKRAKEQCEYLIVGVVTDEGVHKNKKTVPFIPFEERIEMVRSCKYVDEAVEIPFGFGGTRDAYRLYHFDVQFSGSDYENDANWLAERDFLRKHGSDMVFFPYTEQTSSTKIKALIEKQLKDNNFKVSDSTTS